MKNKKLKIKKEPKVIFLILTYNPFKEHVKMLEDLLKSFKNLKRA